ncbi:dihydropteroate synthase [Ulvibacter litoralis]|uniref:Dihydropteroate synthase n=2 Tax=Ulvibacter litoralis TaxID=227084 RepID=A0A1G7GLX7_9FLAO|nr:dihydropteroate synthase [Ulvibacter litoralis]
MRTLNCKGTLIDLSYPKVMGIINVTPDSFYDGGKTTASREIVAQAKTMLDEGATFLDIGGYSSRPNAEEVSEAEELQRVLPAIEAILNEFPEALISIDTFRSEVAKQAVEAGAALVNDISAGTIDPTMISEVAKLNVPYCMMHMRGTPQTMAALTDYETITKEVIFFFSEKIAEARAAGINDILIDPGFGFAKTKDQNFELLKHLDLFKQLEVPCLVGVSRKSMIYKTLETTPDNALNGSTVLHTIAVSKGANILRVHDVSEAVECIKLTQNLK